MHFTSQIRNHWCLYKMSQNQGAPRESQFSSVQSLSRVQLFATPWSAAYQASLSITNSRSSLRLMSIKSVMPSSHLILCRPLLLLPPIPPSISLFQWVNSLHEVAKVLESQMGLIRTYLAGHLSVFLPYKSLSQSSSKSLSEAGYKWTVSLLSIHNANKLA